MRDSVKSLIKVKYAYCFSLIHTTLDLVKEERWIWHSLLMTNLQHLLLIHVYLPGDGLFQIFSRNQNEDRWPKSLTGFLVFSSLITWNPLAPLLFTHSSLAATVLCTQCTFYCLLCLVFYHSIEKVRQSIYLVQSSLLYFLSAMENILIFLMTSVFPFCSVRFYYPWLYRGNKGRQELYNRGQVLQA